MTPSNLYPFDFSDGGGAFIATASSPVYTGMAQDTLIKSYHWHSDKYTLLITALGIQFDVIASSNPGWVKFSYKKATNISVRNSGGHLITSYAAPKRSSMMTNDELVTLLEVLRADAGGVGLTKGTRTLSTSLSNISFYTKDVGIGSVLYTQDLLLQQGDPLFLEDGEGLEASFDTAFPANLQLSIQSVFRMVVLPNLAVKDYF